VRYSLLFHYRAQTNTGTAQHSPESELPFLGRGQAHIGYAPPATGGAAQPTFAMMSKGMSTPFLLGNNQIILFFVE
jgi:hypothetical protein